MTTIDAYLFQHFDSRGGSTAVVAPDFETALLAYAEWFTPEEELAEFREEVIDSLREEDAASTEPFHFLLLDGFQPEPGCDALERDGVTDAINMQSRTVIIGSQEQVEEWMTSHPGDWKQEALGEDAFGLIWMVAQPSASR